MSRAGQGRFLFFKRCFLTWAIFCEVFIEFVTVMLLLLFGFLAERHVGSCLSDQGIRLCTPCIGR